MSGIIWISSYPRSGNTWFRIFLSNLISNGPRPTSIYDVETETFSSRVLFDRTIGWRTSELTAAEADAWRHQVQEVLARERPPVILKTHDAFSDPASGRELFHPPSARCAIHLVRNPLDVAVSVSRHWGCTYDDAIRLINDPCAKLDSGGHQAVLPQRLGDWSAHVRSWVGATSFPILPVRYEDMFATPHATFTQACHFAQLPAQPERIARAIQHSDFGNLQQEERKKWSDQRPVEALFFRSGRPGAWRQALNSAQVAAIVQRHGEMMRRFGYLCDDGTLVA